MCLYLCFNRVSWAEDTNDQVLRDCLGPTFNSWMGMFNTILATSASKMVGAKIQIFKILNVIFRDIKSYGATCIQTFMFSVFKGLQSYLEIYLW